MASMKMPWLPAYLAEYSPPRLLRQQRLMHVQGSWADKEACLCCPCRNLATSLDETRVKPLCIKQPADPRVTRCSVTLFSSCVRTGVWCGVKSLLLAGQSVAVSHTWDQPIEPARASSWQLGNCHAALAGCNTPCGCCQHGHIAAVSVDSCLVHGCFLPHPQCAF